MSVDQRERALRRAVAGGDEDARRALYASEFRRGARHKTLFLLAPDESGVLHLVTRTGALCGFAHVARPDSFRATVVDGQECWDTWAGPDDSLDEGRCDVCHLRAVASTNEDMLAIFCWQIAHGRIVGNRHPDDTVEHYHRTTGRDLKESEWSDCGTCGGTGSTMRTVYPQDEDEPTTTALGGCPVCQSRGWLQRTRR